MLLDKAAAFFGGRETPSKQNTNAQQSSARNPKPKPVSARLKFDTPEPWSEPVDLAPLLDELRARFRRHLALPEGAAEAMALWVVFTHAFDAADISPRLALLSPVPECGKTTAFSLLAHLVPKPLLASNMSPAVVFRAIEKFRPTLLMDEADTYLEQNEEFRGILNSGHTPDAAAVWRCDGQDFTPRGFSTWAPMAIAKIGGLAPTLASRSIIIKMRRKRPDEHVEGFRSDRDAEELAVLVRKLARWAQDNMESLKGVDPTMPKQLSNRAADNWRPLFAIAEVAESDWPTSAREAAFILAADAEQTTLQELLLADIRDVFYRRGCDRITSKDLFAALVAKEGRPWENIDNEKPFTPVRLARMLRPFGIRPRSIRTSPTETPKGYMLDDFEDTFTRYLPPDHQSSVSRLPPVS